MMPQVTLREQTRDASDDRASRDLEPTLVALARGPTALRRALARAAGRLVAVRGWERLGFARLDDYAAERAGVSLVRDLDRADAFEVDARLRRGLALEARHWARVATLLREVVALRLHRDVGFNGIDAYAEERLGLSARRARELLRVERAARECPALGAAFRSGRLGWVRVSVLLALGREPGGAARLADWVAHAQRVSVRRLRDDVDRALALGDFAVPALEPEGSGSGDAGCPEGVQTGASARAALQDARIFFSAEPTVAQLLRAVLAAVQRRLERRWQRPATLGAALEAMLDHAVAAWQPEQAPPREHTVFERDGWRCAAPGCSSHRNLQRHHVVFRSQGGGDEPENLTTLCAWHHLRGIHAGRLRCSGRAPGGLRFELGLRAGREPLAVYGPGEVRMA